ncbi:hypothetical protein MNBD_CHLOROFLEXI01-503, partial [hydrothermal vent metagenome]
ARRKECCVVVLHKRLTTPQGGKSGPALRVASEKAPLGVARRLFGVTKLLSSCLDWRFFRRNSDENETSTDPSMASGLDIGGGRGDIS